MYPDKSPFSKEASSTRFILTHLLPTCLRAASKCGINVIDFVRHVGVSPLTLVPGHGDLPVKELFRLLNEGTLIGWQATPGGHVPVLVAECFQFDYLSDATGYLSSSPNLIAASRLFELVSHLLCPPARLEHHMNQDVVTMVLVYEEEFGDPSVTWSASEAILGTWFRLCRELAPSKVIPLQVEFRHPAHLLRKSCDEFYGVTCEFGAFRDAISLPRAWIEQPLESSLPVLHNYSKERLLRLLKPKQTGPDVARHNATLASELTEMPAITRRLFDHYLQNPRRLAEAVGAVASALQLPVRTLQRRLKDGGTSFSNVQAKGRLFVSKDKLLDPNNSIDEIAEMLGFPDRRTFSIFFKRMTGQTPREWRKLRGIE
ncbi:helix-turn-helix domain-containing protein [Aquabacterium sp.]|uniref:helix-turn-helix domain-containing protein n=1 Tax=Aquabacterium sp. TaxID=1872578 RepID=UPI0040377E37